MALRDYVRFDLANESVAQSIQQMISNSDALSSEAHHRLTPSPVISHIFPVMSDYGWDSKFPSRITVQGKQIGIRREVSRVKPIYDFCRDQIAGHVGVHIDKAREFAKQIRDNTFVIRIEIEDSAEAFEIFERTNARGKELEVTDLLKNYLFSKEGEYLDEDLDDLWDAIVSDFGSTPIKALKQFWISRAGKVNSRQIYRKIRRYADKIGIKDFLDELSDFSDFYRIYNQPDYDALSNLLTEYSFPKEKMLRKEFHRSISVLKMFNITQPIPLILSVMQSFLAVDGDKEDAKKVISLLRAIEFFHIANNKVGGKIGNESEGKYAEFSEKVFKDKDLSAIPGIRSWFEKAMLSLDEFLASFRSLSYDNKSERNTIRYVFDRLVNDGAKDGQTLDLLDVLSAPSGIKPSYDIEHLTPKSHAKDDDHNQILNSIGNLIVIPKQINGILGDKDFSKKIEILKSPHKHDNNIKNVPSYLQQFVDEYANRNWDDESIKSRADTLGGQVFDVLSKKSSYK